MPCICWLRLISLITDEVVSLRLWSLSIRFILPTCYTEYGYWPMWSVSSEIGLTASLIISSISILCGACNWSTALFRYNYQLPAGQAFHTCGGANIWADVRSSSALFCSAGSYCPTNIENLTCSKGYWLFFSFSWGREIHILLSELLWYMKRILKVSMECSSYCSYSVPLLILISADFLSELQVLLSQGFYS